MVVFSPHGHSVDIFGRFPNPTLVAALQEQHYAMGLKELTRRLALHTPVLIERKLLMGVLVACRHTKAAQFTTK